MKICASCKKENDIDDFFCIYCGNSLRDQTTRKQSQETNVVSNLSELPQSPIGWLVLPDASTIPIDQTRQLVGRADLAKFTNNIEKISRRHFTVFIKNNTIYLENLITDNQTTYEIYLNGVNISAKKITPVIDGDSIKISDIELKIKLN